MAGRETFKIWAPPGAKWVDWVRPVPFIALNDFSISSEAVNFTVPSLIYLTEQQEDAAIIIDLPAYDSIKEGIALAKLGIRPIPLYNGTNEQEGARALVNNHIIESALKWGSKELKKIDIAENAPPAFLLDSNRTHRFKMDASIFDNSWDLYAQDIPSAEYFLNNGIDKIIVRSETIQRDLVKILYKFQKKGIAILFTNGYELPKAVTLKKPSRKDR